MLVQQSVAENWGLAAAAKLLQLCPTLCYPIDGSPPDSPVPGILQARTLEWVAISFPSAWKWKWSHSVVSDSSQSNGLQPTRLLSPWDFPGKSTGVGFHCLLHTSSSVHLIIQFSFIKRASPYVIVSYFLCNQLSSIKQLKLHIIL